MKLPILALKRWLETKKIRLFYWYHITEDSIGVSVELFNMYVDIFFRHTCFQAMFNASAIWTVTFPALIADIYICLHCIRVCTYVCMYVCCVCM